MPNTDGGAQDRWQSYLEKKGKITEGAVSLEEVARGMVRFSSNANAEYLMEVLGLDNINRNLQSLSLPAHQPIFQSFHLYTSLDICIKITCSKI